MFNRMTVLAASCLMIFLASCEELPQAQVPSPAPLPPASPHVLKTSDAVLMVVGKAATAQIFKDAFGPGQDGIDLGGNRKIRNELRYSCTGIEEGDYLLELPILCGWPSYFGAGEGAIGQLDLYQNDTHVRWTGEGEPLRPENAAEKNRYQDQLRLDQPLHLKNGDALRIVFNSDGGVITIGPLKLTPGKAKGLPDRPLDDLRSNWLYAELAETQQQADQVTQGCTFFNPGVLPRTFTLRMQARDYLMAPLVPDQTEMITIGPGQSATRSYQFKLSATGRDRFTLIANAPDVFPPVRRVKYFVKDRTEGPRPCTCLNGPDWDFCYAPGAEPGEAPPANAAWKKVTVPAPADDGGTAKGGRQGDHGRAAPHRLVSKDHHGPERSRRPHHHPVRADLQRGVVLLERQARRPSIPRFAAVRGGRDGGIQAGRGERTARRGARLAGVFAQESPAPGQGRATCLAPGTASTWWIIPRSSGLASVRIFPWRPARRCRWMTCSSCPRCGTRA